MTAEEHARRQRLERLESVIKVTLGIWAERDRHSRKWLDVNLIAAMKMLEFALNDVPATPPTGP